MNDHFYLNSTNVLTSRGFIPFYMVKESDSVICFVDNMLQTIKDFTLVSESEVFDCFHLGDSNNIRGTENLSDKISLFTKFKSNKKSDDFVTFKYLGDNYRVPTEVYMAYAFIFLNYFSYNSSDNTFHFRAEDTTYQIYYAAIGALRILSTYIHRYCSNCSLPDDLVLLDGDTFCISARPFPKTIESFIKMLMSYQDRYSAFLMTLERAKLIYHYESESNELRYINIYKKPLVDLILFLLALCHKNPVAKTKDIPGGKSKYHLVYFLSEGKKNEDLNVYHSKFVEDLYNIKLPKEGTLVTSTQVNGFRTVTFGKSLKS